MKNASPTVKAAKAMALTPMTKKTKATLNPGPNPPPNPPSGEEMFATAFSDIAKALLANQGFQSKKASRSKSLPNSTAGGPRCNNFLNIRSLFLVTAIRSSHFTVTTCKSPLPLARHPYHLHVTVTHCASPSPCTHYRHHLLNMNSRPGKYTNFICLA